MERLRNYLKKYLPTNKDIIKRHKYDFTIEDFEEKLKLLKSILISDKQFVSLIKQTLNDKEDIFNVCSNRIEQLLLLYFIDLEDKENPCFVYNHLTNDIKCFELWKQILFNEIYNEFYPEK